MRFHNNLKFLNNRRVLLDSITALVRHGRRLQPADDDVTDDVTRERKYKQRHQAEPFDIVVGV